MEPDHLMLPTMIRRLRNFWDRMDGLFLRGASKHGISELSNAVDALPRWFGRQAGNSIRFRADDQERRRLASLVFNATNCDSALVQRVHAQFKTQDQRESQIGIASPPIVAGQDIAEILERRVFYGERLILREAFFKSAAKFMDPEVARCLIDGAPTPQDPPSRCSEVMAVGGRQIRISPHELISLGTRSGLKVDRVSEVLYYHWLREVPIRGEVHRWMFDQAIQNAIHQCFLIEFERLAERNLHLNANQVARVAAGDVNAFSRNLQKRSIFEDPAVRAINNILFLGPQWIEATAPRDTPGWQAYNGVEAVSKGATLAAKFLAEQVLRLFVKSRGQPEAPGSADNQMREVADNWRRASRNNPIRAQVDRRLKEDFGPSDYKDLRSALVRGDVKDAMRAYDVLIETKNPKDIRIAMAHPHPFTGSAKSERLFLSQLTDEQRKTYDAALEERREVNRKFQEMLRKRYERK